MARRPPVRVPPPHRVAHHWRQTFAGDPRRERLFLSSVSFFSAFTVTRGVTHAIRNQLGPFRNLSIGGRHLHHLVLGIAGLLGTGYLWLLQVGTAHEGMDRVGRATAIAYGGASALTLDEFALWLNLEDVYWTKQGRQSVDAVMVFGALLSMGVLGGPFLRELAREARRF